MKMYTAQEMKVRAAYLEGALADAKTAAMLRQAADAMECEEESDVVFCRKCQTERTGRRYGDVPPHIGEDDICDRCEIAEHLRREELERKRYEYSVYPPEVNGVFQHRTEAELKALMLKQIGYRGKTIVRREVGDWEEVVE